MSHKRREGKRSVFVVPIFSRIGLSSLAAAVLLTATPVRAGGDSWNTPNKSAQSSYSAYRDGGFETQYDNPRDQGAIDDMIELSRYLLRSASQLSKYRVPEVLPMVTRVSRKELDRLACGEEATKCGVSAMYEPTRGIVFSEELEPEKNLFHRSILLHEMVHYMQELGHSMAAAATCERWYQRELEAYAIQKLYLQAIQSPARVAYSGARPTCDPQPEALTHAGKEVRAPGITD